MDFLLLLAVFFEVWEFQLVQVGVIRV